MTTPRCPGQDTRYWTAAAAHLIECPYCGNEMEFFKDEPVLPCRACRREVRNPHIDLGCAKWCQFAKDCLGQLPEAPVQVASLRERLHAALLRTFGQDRRRIAHAEAVLAHAEALLEQTPHADGAVVRAAALLHDIGIVQAEQRHGSSAAPYQELEGPPVARQILAAEGAAAELVEHVCRIVGSHHSAKDIDTLEFRLVWDADWLVNIPVEHPEWVGELLQGKIDTLFKTPAGKQRAQQLWLGGR